MELTADEVKLLLPVVALDIDQREWELENSQPVPTTAMFELLSERIAILKTLRVRLEKAIEFNMNAALLEGA